MNSLMDLADGSLNQQSKEEGLKAALKLHSLQYSLYPPFFSRAEDLPNLKWEKLKFGNDSRSKVPKEQGVYAFVLEVLHSNLMNNAYVLYIGKAGDLNSQNTLHKRYGDYLGNLRRMDRVRISDMLNRYKDNLTYYYAKVPEGISTGYIEKVLLEVFIPPFNTNDFSPELKLLMKGADLL